MLGRTQNTYHQIMTTHDIDTYFATRRTVRAYDPTREIDPSLIRSLIAKAAQHATLQRDTHHHPQRN